MINEKLIKNKDIVLREIHTVFFLINVKEKYYEGRKALIRINEVGKTIWETLDGTDNFKTLCANIIDKYSIPKTSVDSIKKDLEVYCSMLFELGYLLYVK